MVMSASSFSGFPADARILGLDIGSISVDVVLLDGLGTPLYSRYVRHHGQPDKVLCAELEALERTHAGIAAAVTGTGADRVGRLLGACAVNEVIAQVAAASFRYPQARSVIDIGGQDMKCLRIKDGVISGGMIPKVEACLNALDAGCSRALILDGRAQSSLRRYLLDDAPLGTVVVS